mgnify:CR=1 FL=1|tara:strand:+ start:142 stop:1047 length:906 start_codon:yes stop_codon:yes gene_type:complete
MINIGLIGVGYLGEIHLRNIKEIPEFNFIGFYDNNKKRSKFISNKFQAESFKSPDELIAKIDAVNIVTPTINHYDYCLQAIDHLKHVFVEKPLVESYEKALTIKKKLKNKKLKFQIGHIERFNPAYTYSKKFIRNPIYIEAHRLTHFKNRGNDVSVILDLMIHDIDIILNIVDSKIKKINAKGMKVLSKNTDIANVIIEFENGCIANITASRVATKDVRIMKITESDKQIKMNFLKKESKIEFVKSISNNKINTANNNQIKDELTSFKNSIINNKKTLINITDACKSLNLANRILKTINNV